MMDTSAILNLHFTPQSSEEPVRPILLVVTATAQSGNTDLDTVAGAVGPVRPPASTDPSLPEPEGRRSRDRHHKGARILLNGVVNVGQAWMTTEFCWLFSGLGQKVMARA